MWIFKSKEKNLEKIGKNDKYWPGIGLVIAAIFSFLLGYLDALFTHRRYELFFNLSIILFMAGVFLLIKSFFVKK